MYDVCVIGCMSYIVDQITSTMLFHIQVEEGKHKVVFIAETQIKSDRSIDCCPARLIVRKSRQRRNGKMWQSQHRVELPNEDRSSQLACWLPFAPPGKGGSLL